MELYITVSLCDVNLQLFGPKLNNCCRSGWIMKIRAKSEQRQEPLRLRFLQQRGKTDAVVTSSCALTVVFPSHHKEAIIYPGLDISLDQRLCMCLIVNFMVGRGKLFIICCNISSFMHKYEFSFSRTVSVIYSFFAAICFRTTHTKAISAPHPMILFRNAF